VHIKQIAVCQAGEELIVISIKQLHIWLYTISFSAHSFGVLRLTAR